MFECTTRKYAIGEKVIIDWLVKTKCPFDTVVVEKARWEILHRNEIVDSGTAVVDIRNKKTYISVLFNAKNQGHYVLRVYVTIPPETVAAEVYIDVV